MSIPNNLFAFTDQSPRPAYVSINEADGIVTVSARAAADGEQLGALVAVALPKHESAALIEMLTPRSPSYADLAGELAAIRQIIGDEYTDDEGVLHKRPGTEGKLTAELVLEAFRTLGEGGDRMARTHKREVDELRAELAALQANPDPKPTAQLYGRSTMAEILRGLHVSDGDIQIILGKVGAAEDTMENWRAGIASTMASLSYDLSARQRRWLDTGVLS